MVHDALIDAAEKLACHEIIVKLGSQIVNDEQVAVIDEPGHIRGGCILLEGILRQQVEEVKDEKYSTKYALSMSSLAIQWER